MTKRSWITTAALLVATVVVLVFVVVIVNREPDDGGPTAAPASPDTSSTAAPGEVTDQAGQVVPDAMGREVLDVGQVPGKPLEQTEPAGAFPEGNESVGPPAGLELQRVARGVTVGVSTSDGPTDVDEGVLTGFARSARGAGLLAMLHRARVIAQGPEYIDFLEYYFPQAAEQLSPEMLTELESKDSAQMQDYMSTGYLAPSWFKFRFCDSNFCTVETADTPLEESLGTTPEDAQGANQYSVTRVSMAWRNDRWTVVKTDAYNVKAIDDTWERWL